MTAFEAFMFWLGMCWLVYLCKVEQLQPDQPEDELADVDLSDVHRRRVVAEADWRDRPVVNVRLSGRWRA